MGMSLKGNNSLIFQDTIKIKTYKNKVTFPLLKKNYLSSGSPLDLTKSKASVSKKSIYEVFIKFNEAFDYPKLKLIEHFCLPIVCVNFSFENRTEIFDWPTFRQIWRVIFFEDVFDLFLVKVFCDGFCVMGWH